jgi:hypothetical protein
MLETTRLSSQNPPGFDVPSRASDAGPERRPRFLPGRQQAVAWFLDEAEELIHDAGKEWRRAHSNCACDHIRAEHAMGAGECEAAGCACKLYRSRHKLDSAHAIANAIERLQSALELARGGTMNSRGLEAR